MNVVRFSNWGDTFSITGLLATKGAWRLCRFFVIDNAEASFGDGNASLGSP
jgi:hypothetical protein